LKDFIRNGVVLAHDLPYTASPPGSQIASLSPLRNNGVVLTHDLPRLEALLPEGLPDTTVLLDTMEIFPLLYPTIGRYSLSSLTSRILRRGLSGIALEDARLYLRLLVECRNKARHLDPSLRSQAATLLHALKSPWAYLFSPRPTRLLPLTGTERVPKIRIPVACQQEPSHHKSRWEELQGYFSEDGPLARASPDFESRPEQLVMARAVLEAFNEGRFLAVEAGTGVGKSLAYLLPSSLFALKNNTRVVISTHTKNLQDQLFTRDLPLIKELEPEIRFTRLKGRNNYLCLKRWEDWALFLLTSEGREAQEELLTDIPAPLAYLHLLFFLRETREGDFEELALEPRELLGPYLNRVCSLPEECLGNTCPFRDRCFVERARRSGIFSHIVVVNHALLLADASLEEAPGEWSILPDYDLLVIDEAHHLERVATEAFSSPFSLSMGLNFIDQMEARRGLLSRSEIFFNQLSQEGLGNLSNPCFFLLDRLRKELTALNKILYSFFSSRLEKLSRKYEGAKAGSGDHEVKGRVTYRTRELREWAELETDGEKLAYQLETIFKLLTDLGEMLASPSNLPPRLEEERKALIVWSERSAAKAQGFSQATRGFFREEGGDDPPFTLKWWEINPSWRYRGYLQPDGKICIAPIDVGPLIKERLLTHLWSGVFTSATLRSGPSPAGFDFFVIHSGLRHIAREEREFSCLHLDSPFDYSRQARCLVTSDLPEPPPDPEKDSNYIKTTSAVIMDALEASSGRGLILFTSYRAVDKISEILFPRLKERGITCLKQVRDSCNARLLERFREDVHSVLFATSSFWEGVDIPGESLSLLIISKLPFLYFGDPLLEGRMEYIDAVQRGNGWREYYLPKAVMLFRQGLGRLIRRRTDKGVILVLDPRLTRRGYSRSFLETLPAGLWVEEVPSCQVGEYIRNFFGENMRAENSGVDLSHAVNPCEKIILGQEPGGERGPL
jgi:Rad3-related DNA helicase